MLGTVRFSATDPVILSTYPENSLTPSALLPRSNPDPHPPNPPTHSQLA